MRAVLRVVVSYKRWLVNTLFLVALVSFSANAGRLRSLEPLIYELAGDSFVLTRAVFKIIGAYLVLNKGSKRFFLSLKRPILVYKLLYKVGY